MVGPWRRRGGCADPRELRHITWQVLPAHVMIRAVIPSLEQGPERLDAIGMCHGIDVLARRMFHGCVFERQSIIRAGIIRIHGRPRTDSLDHELLQRGAIGTRHHGCTHAIGPIFRGPTTAVNFAGVLGNERWSRVQSI